MPAARKPKSDGSLTLYRLDLDPALAAELTVIAEASERSLPGQIRIALREWLSSRST